MNPQPLIPLLFNGLNFQARFLRHLFCLGYGQIVSGAAERIPAMAEANSQHQRDIEFADLRATEREVTRGQNFGFTIGITALAASIIALWLGSQTVAGTIGGTTVVG
jgi:uncharacterized membrane protein